MDTDTKQDKVSIAFINDKSPIIDKICTDLLSAKFEILFQTENIENAISELEVIKKLPEICIIDLDFYDKSILKQLQKLRNLYPTIQLIAHSDIDDEKIAKDIIDIGFLSYFLLGTDIDDLKKALIDSV
ncbi:MULTISPECIES: response regulator transcription factor [Bacteroidota]|mgnify:CR=1 FL=1|jgi:DNA-binding NarL/FixJ family response regulator|uniref:Response regulatory domain-containing protein n=6 Tax=Bacteroidota TaxID=976 RepID=A0A1X7HWM7_9SPHI|nr:MULTISPECIES: response regulator transcription factor [Bacteroidota]ALU27718.1 histidine kinase [Myroides odoratimimus]EHM7981514.1 response regulator transcription factor [Elizabethkingia anophelis]EHM8033117.1 response regulator transcription factor [Elizabethkingia anophelis]EHZ9535725.1 response regulator transcription factor [Elizabethkingia anophelis]EKU3673633.1 response regulator transcription factor [Elizabethkingia anophelis]